MKGTNCGNDINPNEKFCGSCGAPITGNTNTQPVNNTNSNNTNVSNTNSNKMNKEAIGSIACSIICLFIFWWLGISGIILGVQALKEIKETNEKGKELAYAGIAIGAVAILLYFASKF